MALWLVVALITPTLLALAVTLLVLLRVSRVLHERFDHLEQALATHGDRHLELITRHDAAQNVLQRVYDRQHYGARGPVK